MLSDRQKDILKFIGTYQRRSVVPPSSRTIKTHFGLKSQTSVMRDLAALAAENLVKQTPDRRWATIEPVAPNPFFDLLVLGEIPAGLPDIREQSGGERIAIDPKLFGIRNPNSGHYFALRVKGDSMIEANIVSGDYAICEWCEPRVGDVIAALVDETTVTLKRLVRENGKHLLRAANEAYDDITPFVLEAQGVLRGVIRSGVALRP